MTKTTHQTVELHDGHHIPQFGMGIFQLDADTGVDAVLAAIDIGYRHFDTAVMYGNEWMIGEAIEQSSVPREQLYVTSKLLTKDHRREAARASVEKSLASLKSSWVDLYLIHWPAPGLDTYVDAWRALIELRNEGLIRSIGTSNFEPDHLERLIDETGEAPSINQIELHPGIQQRALKDAHRRLHVTTAAWSPLARGALFDSNDLRNIAEQVDASVSQVILSWHLHRGHVVIPKSSNVARLAENFAATDIQLDVDQLHAIDELDAGLRTGPHPLSYDG
jgi:2,5-diketo-D-gluconate reductase A